MKKIDLNKLGLQKYRTIKLSVWFAILMSIVIIITTSLFALYTLFNIKNLASEYESDIFKLRYSLSTVLIQSFIFDNKKQDKTYESTKNIIDLLKRLLISLKYTTKSSKIILLVWCM